MKYTCVVIIEDIMDYLNFNAFIYLFIGSEIFYLKEVIMI